MDVWEVWERLGNIRELRFEARPHSSTNSGWSGTGHGTVEVERTAPLTLVFHERGVWTPEAGRQMPFRNVFRWTATLDGDRIRLEHLRFGAESPVFLFDLVPIAQGVLEADQPHACSDDRYSARLVLVAETIQLSWAITGPKKDEAITYLYGAGA
jgi:hypothetical protein